MSTSATSAAATPQQQQDSRLADCSWSRRHNQVLVQVKAWCCSDWAGAYVTTDAEEEGYWLEVKGALPLNLCGTYYKNGPGSFEIGNEIVSHPFDGAGLVISVAIKAGKAFFRSHYVETAERQAEQQHSQLLFRGTFSTQRRGFLAHVLDVIPKNAANTGVLLWADKCWALFEAGQPYRLNPVTLATHKLDLLGGRLRRGVPFSLGSVRLDSIAGRLLNGIGVGKHLAEGVQLGGDALTAHPRVDAATGRLVMYSYRLRLGECAPVPASHSLLSILNACLNRLRLHTEVTFWEFDQEMQLISQTSHTLPGYAFLHDFTVTQHYYVIFRNPVSLHLMPFILGQKGAVHSVHWDDRRSLAVHLVARTPSAPAPLDLLSSASHSHKPCLSKIHMEEFACGGSSSTSCSSRHHHNCASNAVNDVDHNHVSPPADSSHSINSSSTESNHTQCSCNRLTDTQSATSPTDCQRRDMSSRRIEATATHGCSLRGRQQAPNKNSTVPVTQRNGLQQARADSTRAAPVHIVQGSSGFVFHHANAFETEKGQVVVDAIRYPTMPDFEQTCGSGRNFIQEVEPDLQPISQLWRHVLDPATATMQARPVCQRAMEYPAVNPNFSGQQTRYVYTAAALHPTLNRPQQAIFKTDTVTRQCKLWSKHARYYVGEPEFIPRHTGSSVGVALDTTRPDATQKSENAQRQCEDDGWVMTLCYDAAMHQSELVVLEASDIEAGPIAVLPLQKTIPHGLHGAWSEKYAGPQL